MSIEDSERLNEYDQEYADDSKDGPSIDSVTGMPIIDDDTADAAAIKMAAVLPLMMAIPRLICLAIAAGIWACKKDLYNARMDRLANTIDGIGYLFLAGGLFAVLVEASSNIPMIWKSKVFPGNAGNMRANMAVFKVQQSKLGYEVDPDSGYTKIKRSSPLGYVMMESEGNIGNYNRSNRAMSHFVENGMHVLICVLLGGLIFGEAVFVLVFIYFLARIWYQIAYATGGYGVGLCKHALPFMVHSVFISHILEMLVWWAGCRMVNIHYNNALAVTTTVAPVI